MMKKHGVNTSELGNAVRRRRESLSLSLRDVADETGVSASTLSRIVPSRNALLNFLIALMRKH